MKLTAIKILLIGVAVAVGTTVSAAAQLSVSTLPADQAGEIGPPQGRIAFIRGGNIWAMDATGDNQMMVCEAINANGRLSWSTDGKYIVFTRQGRVDVRAPDGGGGQHALYDLFLASLDSAFANRPQFWFPLTVDVGSRYPEWTADPKKIVFYKDMQANNVNALQPNYQIAFLEYDQKTTQPGAAQVKLLRDDWQGAERFISAPSMNATGDMACVSVYEQKIQGLLVLKPDEYQLPMDSIVARASQNPNCVSPCWSPDGKWIAYINSRMDDGRLYIATPDLKKKYVVFSPPPGTNLYTVAPSFSPDSKWLTFSTIDGSIWITRITGEGERRLSGPGDDKFPAWSKTP